MTSWSYRPPPRPTTGRERIAAARDLAIIAVCVVILAFVMLAFFGTTTRETPPRATGPAATHVTI
jgi:hypothetical protein